MDNQSKLIAHIKKIIYDKFQNEDRFQIPDKSQLLEIFNSFKSLPGDTLKVVLDLDDSPIDWEEAQNALLIAVAVKHDEGIGITDNNERYNKKWFTEFRQKQPALYYWDRFHEKQKRGLPPKVLFNLKQDTEQVLNLCGDPRRNEQKDVRGLIFGFVQSGKTLNYTSIANAAMDSGYDMIVILAGATNILRKQTQERVLEDVIGWNGKQDIGVSLYDNNTALRPTSLTTIDLDFDKKIAEQKMGDYTLETVNVPVLAVIKKNVHALRNLNKWLESQNRKGKIEKSILLIDDESDYASVNTKDENDPTSINRGIREMLNHFDVSTYLAITATPFANILIDVDNQNDIYGNDLFPRSFIWTLDKPSTYMGVQEIVIDRFRNVCKVNGPEHEEENKAIAQNILRLKKDSDFGELPPFVLTALEDFIYNCVKSRKHLMYTGDLSMMVNMSRFTRHHQELAELLFELLSNFKVEIRNHHIQNCKHPSLRQIATFFESDTNFNCSWSEFNKLLEEVILNTDIIDVHSQSKRELVFTGKNSTNHIVVGGLSLSRGFTVEGLITTVFLRSTKTYDALMQMGRWFGHKQKFAEYISLYTVPEIKRRFESIQEATEDLIDQLTTMRDRGETPKEFGLAIQLDPEVGMQVVSGNRARDAQKMELKLSLDGKLCETTKLWRDPKKQQNNDLATARFMLEVTKNGKPIDKSMKLHLPGKRDQYAYIDVPIDILLEFIDQFDIPHKKLSQITNKMPYFFLVKHLEKFYTHFDFLLIEGEGKTPFELPNGMGTINPSQRIFTESSDENYIQFKNNQLSTGASEESAFLKKKQDKRRLARIKRHQEGPNRPLVLLYRVHARISDREELIDALDFNDSTVWAWSISLPETGIKEKQKLAFVNSVLLKQLAEDEGFENESEYINNQLNDEE